MSFVLNLGALMGVSLFLSLRFRDSLVRTIPVTLCTTVLLLYILAFFRGMAWIDLIAALCLIGLLVLFVLRGRKQGFQAAAKTALRPLRDVQIWVNLAVLVVIVLLVNYRQILEWDAYNFWGADIKSLFYRNGFAGKNSNVASAFGDYPPTMQLSIWWFLHLFGTPHEGLMFGGYYLFGTLLLLSLTDRLRFSGVWQKIFGGAVCGGLLFILPSVVDTSWYRTLCADPIMGILFGCLIVEIFSRQKCTDGFALYKFVVLAAALCLTKSIGFLWVAFAVLFLLVWQGWNTGTLKKAALILGVSGAAYGSWAVFCKLFTRTTYLSDKLGSTLGERFEEILNGTFLSAGENLAFIKSFVKAFLFYPMHREETLALDLTPVLAGLAILGFFLLFFCSGWLSKKETVKLCVSFVCICGIAYFVLLCGHLSIFYSEKKYTDPLNMITTMTRYGCPGMIGFLMLIFAVGAEHFRWSNQPVPAPPSAAIAPWLLSLLIVISAGYNDLSKCLINGADDLNPRRIEYRTKLKGTMGDFLDEIGEKVSLEGEGQRVLLLMDSSDYSPIISYLASPVSIQNFSCPKDEPFTADMLTSALEKVGARWFYVQDVPEEALPVLEALIPEFQGNTLYSADVLGLE